MKGYGQEPVVRINSGERGHGKPEHERKEVRTRLPRELGRDSPESLFV